MRGLPDQPLSRRHRAGRHARFWRSAVRAVSQSRRVCVCRAFRKVRPGRWSKPARSVAPPWPRGLAAFPRRVRDGETGLLVEPNDSPALAKAIERVLDDEPLRLRLIDAGLQAARQQTVECFVGQLLEELYLVARTSPRREPSGWPQVKRKRSSMRIVITPFTSDQVDAVKAFNPRCAPAASRWCFRKARRPSGCRKSTVGDLYHEYFLAADNGSVRGGYILKHQPFYVAGQTIRLSQFRLPLSEGQIDEQYAPLVGVQIYLDAVRKQKFLYTIGIGGYQEAFAQCSFRPVGRHWAVPFYFRVFRPRPFLRNIVYLRTSRLRRLALDTLALTGFGSLAVHAYQALKCPSARAHCRCRGGARRRPLASWADAIWEAAKGEYSLVVAVRDAEILNILYPASDPRWIRLQSGPQGRSSVGQWP